MPPPRNRTLEEREIIRKARACHVACDNCGRKMKPNYRMEFWPLRITGVRHYGKNGRFCTIRCAENYALWAVKTLGARWRRK